MKEFNERVDKIRLYYRRRKADNYPIKNHPLSYLDEDSRKLYLEMLCMIASYSENPTEMQFMFLQRILAGVGTGENIEDYMVRALNINIENFDQFVKTFRNSNLKYSFCVDAIILAGVSVPCEQCQLKLEAELFELLDINESELLYLCGVANAILEQSSEQFIELYPIKPEDISIELFKCYLSSFFVGLLTDSPDEKHYYAYKLSEINLQMQHFVNKEKKFLFENLIIRLENNWYFDRNDSIVFKNCVIVGENFSFYFDSVSRVEFQNCTIQSFKNRIAYLTSVKTLMLNKSRFHNCGCKKPVEWYAVCGGMFVLNGENMKFIEICDCQLFNCYVEQEGANYGPYGVLMDGSGKEVEKIHIMRNKFINCQCINGDKAREDMGLIYNLKRKQEVISDNKFSGPVQQLFMGC